MANEFANKILTQDGRTFLSEASAGNKIVFVKAISSTNALTTESDYTNQSNYDGPEGDVVSSATTDGNGSAVRLQATFTNQSTGVMVKTVAIVAKMESGTHTTPKVMAVQYDSTYGVYIPADTVSVLMQTTVYFTIALTQAGSVTVTPGGNASKGDLDNLLARTVTTHKLNSPTTGEDQSIYGVKTFKNTVYTDGNLVPKTFYPWSSGVYDCGSVNHKWNHVYCIVTDSNTLQPNDITADSKVGTSAKPYKNANITTITANELSLSSKITPANSSVNLGESSNRINTVYCTNVDVSGNLTASNVATLSGTANLSGTTTISGATTLSGTTSVTGSTTFSNTVSFASTASFESTGAAIFYKGIDARQVSYMYDLLPQTDSSSASDGFSLGDSTHKWKSIYTRGLTTYSISRPSTSGVYNIGSDTYKFSNLYCSDVWCTTLHGNSTTATTATDAINAEYLVSYNSVPPTKLLTAYSTSRVNAACNFYPSTTASYSLGSSSYRWNNVYCTNVNCGTKVTTSSLSASAITVSSSITTNSLDFDSLTDDSWSVIANKLCSSTGIGSIRLVCLRVDTSSSTSDVAFPKGTDLSDTNYIAILQCNPIAGSAGGTLSWNNKYTAVVWPGTWKLLSDIMKNTNNNTYHFALIIRTA